MPVRGLIDGGAHEVDPSKPPTLPSLRARIRGRKPALRVMRAATTVPEGGLRDTTSSLRPLRSGLPNNVASRVTPAARLTTHHRGYRQGKKPVDDVGLSRTRRLA